MKINASACFVNVNIYQYLKKAKKMYIKNFRNCSLGSASDRFHR